MKPITIRSTLSYPQEKKKKNREQKGEGKLTALRRMRMYPTQRDEPPRLRKLKNELLLVHRTRIACRVLFRDEERRDDELGLAFWFTQEEPAGLEIKQSVGFGEGEELGEAFTGEVDGSEAGKGRGGGRWSSGLLLILGWGRLVIIWYWRGRTRRATV